MLLLLHIARCLLIFLNEPDLQYIYLLDYNHEHHIEFYHLTLFLLIVVCSFYRSFFYKLLIISRKRNINQFFSYNFFWNLNLFINYFFSNIFLNYFFNFFFNYNLLFYNFRFCKYIYTSPYVFIYINWYPSNIPKESSKSLL